jgi:lipid-binding SYLF domain-containing protein
MERIASKVGSVGFLIAFSASLLFAATTPARADDRIDAQIIVDEAKITFEKFMRDRNYTWLHKHLKNAKGLLIFPQILKAGFILGGSGGTGVLVVRDSNTKNWSQPAFYTLGSMTFGFQIGGEAAEVLMLAMSHKAIDSLFVTSVKLGGDASVAAGPFGAGEKTDVSVDFMSFAKSKGLYAGLNLEGSIIDVREGLNKAYYGRAVRPLEIIVEKKVSNKGADGLREALKNAVK